MRPRGRRGLAWYLVLSGVLTMAGEMVLVLGVFSRAERHQAAGVFVVACVCAVAEIAAGLVLLRSARGRS